MSLEAETLINENITYQTKFWDYVQKTESCWNWTGNTNKLCIKGKKFTASRFAYTMMVKDILPHMQIIHTCHNSECVNPDHLKSVTIDEKNRINGKIRRRPRKIKPPFQLPHSFTDIITSEKLSDIAIAYHKERFWKNVTKTDSCWQWNGTIQFRVCSKNNSPSRFSYELVFGKLADKLRILHTCKNKKCVNPDHLEALTANEIAMRNDSICARNKKKTHCKYGHLLAGENLLITKNNHRECKICKKKRSTLSYQLHGMRDFNA